MLCSSGCKNRYYSQLSNSKVQLESDHKEGIDQHDNRRTNQTHTLEMVRADVGPLDGQKNRLDPAIGFAPI